MASRGRRSRSMRSNSSRACNRRCLAARWQQAWLGSTSAADAALQHVGSRCDLAALQQQMWLGSAFAATLQVSGFRLG
jgi:hypothetical protein